MEQPISNGLFEMATTKVVRERGFNCMKLIEFLTEDEVKGWDDWHGAHLLAAQGECVYANRCPIYERTAKNRPVQLNLF